MGRSGRSPQAWLGSPFLQAQRDGVFVARLATISLRVGRVDRPRPQGGGVGGTARQPEANPELVWHIEDVLDVYTRPYDPKRPQVCLDETSRQLLAEVRPPQPPAPGRPARYDAEYAREG